MGDDDTFGTADDKKVNFNNETVLYYNNITKNFPPGITGSNKYNFKNESLQEILEEMHAQIKGILEYFDRNVNNEVDRKEVQARKEELKQNIASTIEMIKQNQIKVAVESERGLLFYQENQEILKQLRTQIENAQSVLGDLNISLGTSVETLPEYKRLTNVTLTKKGVLKYSRMYGFESGVIKSYHKDAEPEHYTDWEKVNPEVETKEDSVYVNKGNVMISDDLSKIKVVHSEAHTTEIELTKQDVTTKEETDYVVKEIITPIRAYKVMVEGNVVVNHYYKEATPKSEVPKDAPVLEVPEFKGSVNGELSEPLTLPELIISKKTNDNPKKEGQTSKPQQKIEQSSKDESKNNVLIDESKQKIKEIKQIKQNDATASNKDNEYQTSVPTNKVEELPQTGTGNEFAIFGAAASSILAGLGLVIPEKQRKE